MRDFVVKSVRIEIFILFFIQVNHWNDFFFFFGLFFFSQMDRKKASSKESDAKNPSAGSQWHAENLPDVPPSDSALSEDAIVRQFQVSSNNFASKTTFRNALFTIPPFLLLLRPFKH